MAQQEALNQHKVAAMNMQSMPKPIAGLSILRLVQYQNDLGTPERPDELDYWESFVAKFFSPEGVLRQQLWNSKSKGDKTYRIEYPSLPRFYLAHFLGGIQQIWMSVLGASEKALVHAGHHTVWSVMASTKYAYKNGSVVVTLGRVKVNFDSENRIELLDISTSDWKEYIPREMIVPPKSPPDQKESPRFNKNKRQPQKLVPSPPSPPIPDTRVNEYGVPKPLMQYLEVGFIGLCSLSRELICILDGRSLLCNDAVDPVLTKPPLHNASAGPRENGCRKCDASISDGWHAAREPQCSHADVRPTYAWYQWPEPIRVSFPCTSWSSNWTRISTSRWPCPHGKSSSESHARPGRNGSPTKSARVKFEWKSSDQC
jgi:hypothetical protein